MGHPKMVEGLLWKMGNGAIVVAQTCGSGGDDLTNSKTGVQQVYIICYE